MSVEGLDLRHQVDDLEAIVRLLSKWIAKEIKLLQVLELGQLDQELVKVTELIVTK